MHQWKFMYRETFLLIENGLDVCGTRLSRRRMRRKRNKQPGISHKYCIEQLHLWPHFCVACNGTVNGTAWLIYIYDTRRSPYEICMHRREICVSVCECDARKAYTGGVCFLTAAGSQSTPAPTLAHTDEICIWRWHRKKRRSLSRAAGIRANWVCMRVFSPGHPDSPLKPLWPWSPGAPGGPRTPGSPENTQKHKRFICFSSHCVFSV